MQSDAEELCCLHCDIAFCWQILDMLCEDTIAVRTKALKCLTSVITVDPSVLALVSCTDFYCRIAHSTLTLLVGQQEGHLACKKLSAGVLAWLSF